MNEKKQKLIVFLIGLFAILASLEIGLRILGYVHLKSIEFDEGSFIGDSDNQYTILTLGDSFIEGVGAPIGQKYPDHLQNLLNSKFKEKNIVVINRGVGNQNTAQLLNKLEQNIDSIKPDIITIMIGGANTWNYWGYYSYLKGNRIYSYLYNFIHRIRVYKLIKIFLNNLNDQTEIIQTKTEQTDFIEDVPQEDIVKYYKSMKTYAEGLSYYGKQNYEEALKLFLKGINEYPKNSLIYSRIGIMYFEQQNYEEAVKWFKRGVKVNPDNYIDYYFLGVIFTYQGDYDKALELFKEGVIVNPDSEFNWNYHGLVSIYQTNDSYKGKVLTFLEELAKNNAIVLSHLKLLKEGDVPTEIENWVKSDLTEIIKISSDKGVRIIVQGYPHNAKVNKILKKTANEHDVPFVDNFQKFNELWAKGEKRSKYLAIDDLHCNGEGYKIIAKNVYYSLIKEFNSSLK